MSLLERLYAFHHSIEQGRFPNATMLVNEFEISLATAKRDIAYLRDRLLAPLAYNPQKFGYYYTEEGFSLPFSESPKLLLFVALLNTLARETGLADFPEVRQLHNRLSSLLPADYKVLNEYLYCEWIEIESIDHRMFALVLDGLARKRLLRIQYSSARTSAFDRLVEPQRLCNYQGRWYLLAFCRLRQDLRLFHLSRIQQVELLDESITVRPDLEENYLKSSFGIFKGEPKYTAEIRFTGAAAQLVRHQRWHADQETRNDDSGLVLRLPVHDDRELIMKILQYGAMVEVLGPPALRRAVSEQIGQMSAVYRDSEPKKVKKDIN